ncbi:MAG TPA: histidine kinase [Jiangellaceae bacterium]|nr:histidine kinase [Jiangellaceae bacterium]
MTGTLFGRNDPQRVDAYNRTSAYVFVLIEPFLGLALIGRIEVETPAAVLAALLVLAVVHAAACLALLRASLRYRLEGGPRPDLQRAVAGAVTVAGIVLVQVWRDYLALPSPEMPELSYFAVLGLVLYYGGTLAAGLPGRGAMLVALVGFGTVVALGLAAGHVPHTQPAVLTAVIWAAAAVLMGSSFPTFVWISRVVWELDRSRQTQARLAVAEERLRFARDLHDVLGRNLSVIALKSELAARLGRRDVAAAGGEMEEVRELAESSLKEVRDVVRGYRATDLDAELAGSKSVLDAAGVRVVTSGTGAGLPQSVQETLAWVVREGTTNVLRHSEAGQCGITVRVDGDAVVLTMENDGATDASRSATGSGLIGLRERLQASGGTLTGARIDRGRYRLRAALPLHHADRS